jgi:hypothetical protein
VDANTSELPANVTVRSAEPVAVVTGRDMTVEAIPDPSEIALTEEPISENESSFEMMGIRNRHRQASLKGRCCHRSASTAH